MKYLKQTDPEIALLIEKEKQRQENTLMMIPSENIASLAVEEAIGSCLGNKYAEGYPGRRYYQGQEFVDQIEILVIERAKQAFGIPHANVQPLSGSPANTAVYFALLKPFDKLMGLSLAFGGHLTHGSPVSISGMYYQPVPYGLDKNGVMDYEAIEKIALTEKPRIIVAGTTAYPLRIDWKRFADIAEKVDAILLADISHLAGLILGNAYPSPVPYAHVITTTTHKTLRGARGAIIMVTEKGLRKDPDMGKKIDKAVFPGLQGGPHINTIAGIGVTLQEARKPSFQTYASQIIKNAKTIAHELAYFGFHIVSGGTESHLIVCDLSNKYITGNLAAEALEHAGIVLNRNAVPFDKNPPFYPSGIRLGTPGVTSRGMKEKEMKLIAQWIHEVIDDIARIKKDRKITYEQEKQKSVRSTIIQQSKIIKQVAGKVLKLCKQYPIQNTY